MTDNQQRGGQKTGSQGIGTIRAGQGARVTTRENAAQAADIARANAVRRHQKRHASSDALTAAANGARRDGGRGKHKMAEDGPERNTTNIMKIVALAFLVLVMLFILGSCVTSCLSGGAAKSASKKEQSTTSEAAEQIANEQQQVVVGVDEIVSYMGVKYQVAELSEGSWGVTSDGATAFTLEGTPAALVLYNGMLLVPENTDSGWDVALYVLSDGSVPSYAKDSDGNRAGGSGSVTSADLDGSTLKVVDSEGATTSIPLE